MIRARNEISKLVEYTVIRQVMLVIDAGDFSIEKHRSGVVCNGRRIGVLLVAGFRRSVRKPHDDGNRSGASLSYSGGKLFYRLSSDSQELWSNREVFDGIPRQRHFGERDDVGARRARIRDRCQDFDRIAREIAEAGIGLRESDTQVWHTR